MNNLEKYLDQVIEQKPIVYEPPAEVQEPPTTNVLGSVRRRWYIVVAVALVICAIGLPAAWYLVQPVYVVRGAVQIQQNVPGILPGVPGADDAGSYAEPTSTWVYRMTNDAAVLQLILEDLVPRNLDFFSGKPSTRIEKLLAKFVPPGVNPSADRILKEAIIAQDISAASIRDTDLITVTMRSHNEEEARMIVDAFLQNFRRRYVQKAGEGEAATVTALETEERELRDLILALRARQDLATEGNAAAAVDPNLAQELENDRLHLLRSELVRLEAQRIRLEADLSVFDPNHTPATPEEIVTLRTGYVKADPMMAELSRNIVQMERDLIVSRQTQKEANPLFQQRQAVLDALTARRDELQKTLEAEFDEQRAAKVAEAADARKKQAPEELKQVIARIAQVNQMAEEQEGKVKKAVQEVQKIQRLGTDLEWYTERLEQVTRRRLDLQRQLDRRGLIEISNFAQRIDEEDKRPKFAAMTVFVALACGMGLALLRDKVDKTLQGPEDVARETDLPILGTTTSSRTVKPALFAEQIAGDYQTIRTNLGLLYNGGTPKRLVVSSASAREGKTTFAVNLATSLAKSGKKVLLIDGDLRKPDIGHMLNVLNNTGGLQNVLLGEDPGNIVCVLPSSGLHVLAANPRYLGDAYELLMSSTAAEQMERLAREYDHLIVDSPPTLAFPDALVWAKLSDAVILVSFAGQTTAPDLKEAKERFSRIRARILGAVVSNVPVDQGLYRHGYTYRPQNSGSSRKAGKPKKLLLSTPGPRDGDRPADAEA